MTAVRERKLPFLITVGIIFFLPFLGKGGLLAAAILAAERVKTVRSLATIGAPSDPLHVRNGVFQNLLVAQCFSHTHIQRDLCNTRNFHHILQSQVFFQLGNDFARVLIFQRCHVFYLSTSQLPKA